MISHYNRKLNILVCKNFICYINFNKLFLSEVKIKQPTGKNKILKQITHLKTVRR